MLVQISRTKFLLGGKNCNIRVLKGPDYCSLRIIKNDITVVNVVNEFE